MTNLPSPESGSATATFSIDSTNSSMRAQSCHLDSHIRSSTVDETLGPHGTYPKEIPLTDPAEAAVLVDRLGDDRTGGVYAKDGCLVLTVTDQAAAETVRAAGGQPELVERSTAELAAIHDELDKLGAINSTAWGAKADTNQVEVKVQGLPARDPRPLDQLRTRFG
ncbi:hypothetical protein [Streptomyces sp. NPDC029674]|uniref:hypothetical protein n=1 Tax=Streptomyces sp. NPDC029674 TaxID=3365297 RepID=UPI00384CDFBF